MSYPHPIENVQSDAAFEQLSLETAHLEMTYQSLQERFKAIQVAIQDFDTRQEGKLAELSFISHYLETILDRISQGILFIDFNGIVTTYNESAQEILGISAQELLFRPFCDHLDDSFLGFSLREILMTKRCPSTSFTRWHRSDQTIELEVETTLVMMNPQTVPLDQRQPEVPLLIAGNPLLSKEFHLGSQQPASIQGILVLLRDVTKMRRLQQMANRNDRLKELGELAAHLAHEIRNPLGGIKGFASLLKQELKERPDLDQMACYIEQGCDDLNRFVSNMLEYARPFQLHIEHVDLIHLIEELKQLMQVDQNWKESVEFILQSPCPKVMVHIDSQLFKSALLNLFVNAMQAMPDGGTLTVEIEIGIKTVTLCVRDSGKGILQENMSKLFTPFFTTKESGNGCGLVEVQKVIHAHQGSIDVYSEVGKGAEFKIKIPINFME